MTTLGSQLGRRLGLRPRFRSSLDSGSVVVGWLGRLVITLAILGIVAFEVLSRNGDGAQRSPREKYS